MTFLTTGVACLIADLLLLSAGFKVFRWAEYLDAIQSYRTLRRFPAALRSGAAMAVPPAELAIAVLVLVPAARSYGLALACVMFAVFYLVVGGDDRAVIANCGCWGRASFGVSRRVMLIRNVILTGLAGLAFAMYLASSNAAHGTSALATLVATGMALPFALLILETPELHMLAQLRPAGASQTLPPSRSRRGTMVR